MSTSSLIFEGGLTLSETNNSPGGGSSGGNRAWPLFVGLPIIVALAVAAVILIGGGAGQDQPDTAQNAAQDTVQDGPSGQSPQPTTEEAGEQASQQAPQEGDQRLGSPALGDEGAPVVMVEYSDYQ